MLLDPVECDLPVLEPTLKGKVGALDIGRGERETRLGVKLCECQHGIQVLILIAVVVFTYR